MCFLNPASVLKNGAEGRQADRQSVKGGTNEH